MQECDFLGYAVSFKTLITIPIITQNYLISTSLQLLNSHFYRFQNTHVFSVSLCLVVHVIHNLVTLKNNLASTAIGCQSLGHLYIKITSGTVSCDCHVVEIHKVISMQTEQTFE